MNVFVLNMTGLVLNMTEIVLTMTGIYFFFQSYGSGTTWSPGLVVNKMKNTYKGKN